MYSRLLGRVIVFKESTPSKTSPAIRVRPSGSEIFASLWQNWKAPVSIYVASPTIETSVRLLQLLKVYPSHFLDLFPMMVTLFKLLHPLKAFSPMYVTLAGIFTEVTS